MKGFFAYSSKPFSSGEVIEKAVQEINTKGKIQIKTWTAMPVGGRYIIKNILDNIDETDLFLADLTGLNNNVLFELGYAIGKKKPVQLFLDTSYTDYKRLFNEFQLLTTIGYISYYNSSNIINALDDEKNLNTKKTLFDDLIDQNKSSQLSSPFLYLKSQIPTDYGQEVINQSDYFKLQPIIDDPTEDRIQAITWYVENISRTPSVLAEFSSTKRDGHIFQNLKCAFISGLALGLGKYIKMVVESPYDETPVDYRELLAKFNNITHCRKVVRNFLNTAKDNIAAQVTNNNSIKQIVRTRSNIDKISFGEHTAEHESNKLYDYYVPITHVDSLVKNEYNIIVGRKGSGKTAALYYLNSLLNFEKRNLVVLIKPVNFELDGIVKLLENLEDDFELGYAIESVWKFLIYSEIARNIYDKIKNTPLYAISETEQSYIDFIEHNPTIFLTDLSTRLEERISAMIDSNQEISNKQADFRLKIAEILHDTTIYKVRELFASVISKNEKIVVLIDNLDKSWRRDSNHKLLSRYILGLLGSVGRIHGQLSVIKSKNKNIQFSLAIFLRSDIFQYILLEAREPDKIEVTKLFWNDQQILIRIIEERFVALSQGGFNDVDLWDKMICYSVGGEQVKSYIFNRIYPRPRDLIYFLNRAKDVAVSRGHKQIEDEDIIHAYKEYSTWVFDSLVAESSGSGDSIREFLYRLSGNNAYITEDDIILIMMDINIIVDETQHDEIKAFTNKLLLLSIIGVEVKQNDFRFDYFMEDSKVVSNMALKHGSKKYKIHPSLYSYLEIIE